MAKKRLKETVMISLVLILLLLTVKRRTKKPAIITRVKISAHIGIAAIFVFALFQSEEILNAYALVKETIAYIPMSTNDKTGNPLSFVLKSDAKEIDAKTANNIARMI
jgi:ribosome-binding factor A